MTPLETLLDAIDRNSFGESADNARRLLDAAPDLLAALLQAKDLIIAHQELGCPAGPVCVPSAIRDAIAKATPEPRPSCHCCGKTAKRPQSFWTCRTCGELTCTDCLSDMNAEPFHCREHDAKPVCQPGR